MKSTENAGYKKMKVREIFWNTKLHLSFPSYSAAALIKRLSDGKIKIFFGHQVILSKSVQNKGNFDNGEWKQCPTKRPVSKQPNFYSATFLQQGCQTCLRCARPISSRYKLQLEIETITIVIWLIAENFSKFEQKIHGVWKKLFGSVVGTKIYMSTCLFCERYISEAKI